MAAETIADAQGATQTVSQHRLRSTTTQLVRV